MSRREIIEEFTFNLLDYFDESLNEIDDVSIYEKLRGVREELELILWDLSDRVEDDEGWEGTRERKQ